VCARFARGIVLKERGDGSTPGLEVRPRRVRDIAALNVLCALAVVVAPEATIAVSTLGFTASI
jgi:hypothetical protein